MCQDNRKKRSILSNEVVLGLFVPIVGCILAYQFEAGFCSKFDIPASLIRIDLFDFLKYAGGLTFFIVLLWKLLEIFHKRKIHLKPIISKIIFNLIVILVGFFFIFSYEIDLKYWPIFLILPLYIIYLDFIRPLLFSKKIKGYKQKLKYANKMDQKEESLTRKAIRMIGIFPSAIILLTFVLICWLPSIGAFSAKTKQSFVIIKSNPELVVLRKYSSRYICAEFDREKREVQNRFILKTLDQIAHEGLELEEESIGPLKLFIKKK